MTKTEPKRQLTFPQLDPIETEILELQLATLTLEIAMSEGHFGPPPFLARGHALLRVAGQADVVAHARALQEDDSGGADPRPPPS